MPERVYHRRKAQYNTKVAAHLREHTPYIDWAVTATFYAALHLVDSMLAVTAHLPKDEQHPRSTPQTPGRATAGVGATIWSRAEFGATRKAYRSLEEASRRARYDLTARPEGVRAVAGPVSADRPIRADDREGPRRDRQLTGGHHEVGPVPRLRRQPWANDLVGMLGVPSTVQVSDSRR